jgi:hypothetical protein
MKLLFDRVAKPLAEIESVRRGNAVSRGGVDSVMSRAKYKYTTLAAELRNPQAEN